MIHLSQYKKGFVLLYIMLVLASIITAIALAAGMSGTFSGNKIRAYDASAKTRMIAMQCAENLLMTIRNTPSTSSSGTLIILDGSCTYSISGTSPVKIISLTATRDVLYKRITITTSQINPTISSSWIETAN